MVPEGGDDDDIDGRKAWLVVIGAFLVHFAASGSLNSFGVYLQHYKHEFANLDTAHAQLSMIGSIATGLRDVLGCVAGPVTSRIGYRRSVATGAVLIIVGFFLASMSTCLWQLYLTQGVMVGIGASLVYYPSACVPSQWFLRRRGIANGIAVSGTGMGGFVISTFTSYMLENFGMKAALGAQSALVLAVFIVAIMLIRERRGIDGPTMHATSIIDWSIFRDTSFVLFMIGLTTVFWAYYVPFHYLTSSAGFMNLTTSQGGLLLGFLSLSSAIGRISLGYLSDSLGAINCMVSSVVVAALACLTLWPLATAFYSLLMFAIIFGAASGGFVALVSNVLATEFGLERLPMTTGIQCSLASTGTFFGASVGGLLITAFTNGHYTQANHESSLYPVMAYTGIVLLLGALIISKFAARRSTTYKL